MKKVEAMRSMFKIGVCLCVFITIAGSDFVFRDAMAVTIQDSDKIWERIKNKSFKAKNPEELFLARFSAFKRLADSESKLAEAFLIETMTIRPEDYPFARHRSFVKSVKKWEEPDIRASRDQNDLRAVVYQLNYETSEIKGNLYEISFFKKIENGDYFFTHKYDLNKENLFQTQAVLTPIRQYGDTVLKQAARPVQNLSAEQDAIQNQILILKRALKTTGGVGIAANQSAEIEAPYQIILAGVDYNDEDSVRYALSRYPTTLFPMLQIYLNPTLLGSSGQVDFAEGCLSLRGSLRGLVRRSDTIRVFYLDLQGHEHITKFTGSDARVMLHEIDHIKEGKVFFDRILDDLAPNQVAEVESVVKKILVGRDQVSEEVPVLLPSPEVVFKRNKNSDAIEFELSHLEKSLRHSLTTALRGIAQALRER